MSKIAILELDGKKYEFPVIQGSENEVAIDIDKLRSASGAITIDPGYKNSGSCKSEITFLDGEEGILRYRGYSIEDLADKANFLEVSYLLIFGELPTNAQLEKFENDIRKYTLVNEEILLGSFGTLLHNQKFVEKEENFFIFYADTLTNVNLNEMFVQGFNELHFLTFGFKAKISDFTITYKDNGKEIIREFKNEFYSFCKALDRQAANQPAFTYDWFEDGKQFRLVIYEYNYPFAPSSSEGSSVGEGVLLVK